MTWIDAKKRLPEELDAGYSINVLITDGENISIGYHEYEYFAEDPNELTQYSSPVWHDDANLLTSSSGGWGEVTHWKPLPKLSKTFKKNMENRKKIKKHKCLLDIENIHTQE